MRNNSWIIWLLVLIPFEAFCIFEGSNLMLNIGATVLVVMWVVLLVQMIRNATRKIEIPDNICPKCHDGIMCPLRSLSVKICNSCGHNVEWKLKEGQLPLVSNNRQTKRTKS